MSGTMMPGAAPPQMPPQMLQALLARMQQGAQQPPAQPAMAGPAQAATPGPAQMPQQPPPGQPAMPPRSMAGIAPPMPGNMGSQGAAQQGRFGDRIMAHMTPGEIAVPPQVQTPDLMAALKRAFAQMGVSPQQFTAGSPASSTNPATGAPEYSLWSALLPIVGAIGGSFIPGIGTAAGAALGGGLGGAAGGAIDHAGPMGTLLGAAGGAAGGYLGGGGLSDLMGGAAPLTGATPGLTWNPANPIGTETLGAGTVNPFAAAAGAATPAAGASSIGDMLKALPWKAGLYAGIGSGVGSSFAPPPSTGGALPSGFNKPMNPVNPNFGQALGSGQASTPTFADYSPYSAVMGPNPGYRFFPTGG